MVNNRISNNSVRAAFKSVPRNVSLARLMVSAMLAETDILLADLDEIKVAVSEAVSNAIIHGYQNDPNQSVNLTVHIVNNHLIVEVSDDGVGIADIKQAMQPNYSQIEERMGLGFCFMQSFMDEVKVSSELGEGTSVTLIKCLPVAGEDKKDGNNTDKCINADECIDGAGKDECRGA